MVIGLKIDFNHANAAELTVGSSFICKTIVFTSPILFR
jgi:hypothetical protein